MRLNYVWSALALGLLGVAAGCDKDPARPTDILALQACPTGAGGRIDVNAPIAFTFSTPVRASTVTAGNFVFSNAQTGVEIPGNVAVSTADASGRTVLFTPSSPFGFDQSVRVRVQNVLANEGNASLPVTVCQLLTALPPIRELFFSALPQAGGNDLLGVSLTGVNSGFVISRAITLFKSTNAGDFVVAAAPPQFSGSYDVSFVDAQRGFASFEDIRKSRAFLAETRDGGITFDTVFSTSRSQNKVYFRRQGNGTGDTGLFGVIGGGSGGDGVFVKYQAGANIYSSFQVVTNTGSVNDIDFGPDTAKGAGVTLGVSLGTFLRLGRVYYTTNGGNGTTAWTEVPNSVAPRNVLTYNGVAMQGDSIVWVVGGNAYAAKYRRNADGSITSAPVVFRPDTMSSTGFGGPRLVSIDSTNPYSLIFTDVEFSKIDPRIGFIVGAQQTGVLNGAPRYQGLIYATRDGGATWRRQGVRGANSNGAEFPRLNRINILNQTTTGQPSVWVVGDAGFTAAYGPCGLLSTPTPTQSPNGDIACQ